MAVFAGQIVTADFLHNLDTSGTYTPELTAATTDPDLGSSGSATGRWHRNGDWIEGTAEFHFDGGDGSGGSGIYRVSLPFDADVSFMAASAATGGGSILGSGIARPVASGSAEPLTTFLFTTTSILMVPTSGGNVSDSNPFVWGSDGHRLAVSFLYLADAGGLP